jgi:hypothetical protein
MTVLVILIIVAVAVFVAMKTGKVKDANNNNIPDAIEAKVEEVKEIVADVKEVVAKVAKAPKAKPQPALKAKPTAKKTTKK